MKKEEAQGLNPKLHLSNRKQDQSKMSLLLKNDHLDKKKPSEE